MVLTVHFKCLGGDFPLSSSLFHVWFTEPNTEFLTQDWELSTRTKLKTGLQMQIKGSCFIISILASIWISTCLTRFKIILESRRGLPPQFSTTKAFSTHHYQPVIARVNISFCNGWERLFWSMNPVLTAYARRADALSKGDSELFIVYSNLLVSIYRKSVWLFGFPVSWVSYR